MPNIKERELTHEAAAELLPWYASASLSESEAAQVKTHIAGCAECQQEMAVLAALREAICHSNEALPEPSVPSFDRVRQRIGAYEEAQAKNFWPQLRRLFALPWSFRHVAFAGQFAVWLLLLGTILLALQRARDAETAATQERARAEQTEQQLAAAKRQYSVLAGPDAPSVTNHVSLKVVFQEKATEQEIRALLTAINGTIIRGPSPQRFYVIVLPVPQEADRAQILRAALERLQAQAQVVLFAAEKTD
ncbi:MAG TPA: zf-HC2 domain-containing protein [Blastocatellia bacterium]|nr:zf-HC2 domain-containing protein [Blastocatellia bacterium]